MVTARPRLQVSALFGLSVILDYLTIFRNHPEVDFEVEFNSNLIEILRPNYSNTYYALLNSYFKSGAASLNNVTFLGSNTNFPIISPEDLIGMLGTALGSMSPYNVTEGNDVEVRLSKFIVLNTKVITGKDLSIQDMWTNSVKDQLFKLLNEYEYDIVLIGEKNYSDCYEYTLHSTFSIYNDIVKGGLNNLVDLTVEDTVSLYEEHIILRNLNYLSKSLFNIHIGEGGGIKIFGHANNMLAFTKSPVDLLEYVNTDNFTEYSFNPDEFLKKVGIKLKQYA
jgi:hypothetical protein